MVGRNDRQYFVEDGGTDMTKFGLDTETIIGTVKTTVEPTCDSLTLLGEQIDCQLLSEWLGA